MKHWIRSSIVFHSQLLPIKTETKNAETTSKRVEVREVSNEIQNFQLEIHSQSPREEDIESQSDVEFDFPSLLFHSPATSQLYK